MWPNHRTVWWNSDLQPDYRQFIAAAKAAGAKVILYFDQDLTEESIEEAEQALELARVEPEEYREYARAIGEFRSWIGFTCRVAIGFASEGMFYFYDLESDWYSNMLDMVEELRLSAYPFDGSDDDDEPGGNPPMGNYYSNN